MSALTLLLGFLPALFLVIALVQGRYPGERVLARLRARGRRFPASATQRIPSHPSRTRRRSGELLASALAGRGPPGALA